MQLLVIVLCKSLKMQNQLTLANRDFHTTQPPQIVVIFHCVLDHILFNTLFCETELKVPGLMLLFHLMVPNKYFI